MVSQKFLRKKAFLIYLTPYFYIAAVNTNWFFLLMWVLITIEGLIHRNYFTVSKKDTISSKYMIISIILNLNHKQIHNLLDEGFPIINARREITVLINPRFGIRVEYSNRIFDTIRYLKPQNKNTEVKVPKKVRQLLSLIYNYAIAARNGKLFGGWKITTYHLSFYTNCFLKNKNLFRKRIDHPLRI